MGRVKLGRWAAAFAHAKYGAQTSRLRISLWPFIVVPYIGILHVRAHLAPRPNFRRPSVPWAPEAHRLPSAASVKHLGCGIPHEACTVPCRVTMMRGHLRHGGCKRWYTHRTPSSRALCITYHVVTFLLHCLNDRTYCRHDVVSDPSGLVKPVPAGKYSFWYLQHKGRLPCSFWSHRRHRPCAKFRRRMTPHMLAQQLVISSSICLFLSRAASSRRT